MGEHNLNKYIIEAEEIAPCITKRSGKKILKTMNKAEELIREGHE